MEWLQQTIDQKVMQTLIDLFMAGGAVLWLITVLSVLTLAMIIYKAVEFQVIRLEDLGFVSAFEDAVCKQRADEAARSLSASRNPLALVLQQGVQVWRNGKPGDRLASDVSDVLRSAMVVRLLELERYLKLLSMIATLSPLLGLLGTVIGMIQAFQAMEVAGTRVDPSILSGGIWTALLTTAAGLVVAIPAAAAHGWFEGRLDRFAARAEDVIARMARDLRHDAELVEQDLVKAA